MDPVVILVLQFDLTLIVFGAVALWFATPWLSTLTRSAALTIRQLRHALRHFGLSFLVA